MPELPEVEQVKKTLGPHVVGQTIKSVEIRLPRLIQHPTADVFAQKLTGAKIIGIERRGKYLRLNLAGNMYILVHLRMTGALLAWDKKAAEPPYAKVKFTLTGTHDMWFTDIRTFGTLYLIDKDDFNVEGYTTLGPEPNTPELTVDYLYRICRKKKAPIKNVILDQKIIAGLGNIYADESLFISGILPTRSADTLTEAETQSLLEAINAAISQGIRNHGTTFRNYQDGEGKQGSNQNHLWAYGRKGQVCKQCGATMLGTKVGGRGTSYCPCCQK